MNKDPESWRRVSVELVIAGSKARGENVLRMAIEDILRLDAERNRAVETERRRCIAILNKEGWVRSGNVWDAIRDAMASGISAEELGETHDRRLSGTHVADGLGEVFTADEFNQSNRQ